MSKVISVEDVYKILPEEISSSDVNKANEEVCKMIKTAIGAKEFNEELFKKTSYILPIHANKIPPKKRPEKSFLSRKERKKLNLLKCPKEGWKYKDFKGLRQLWQGYMTQFLRLDQRPIAAEDTDRYREVCTSLYKADFHGAQIKIVRSKCPSLVGICGTCVIDTKNVFRIISRDDKLRTIPKKDSVFEIKFNNMKITLFGKYIQNRPADRFTKKMRKKEVIFDL